MTTKSFLEAALTCPDEDLPLLRELLSYDMQCETSCGFARQEFGRLVFSVLPSPLHWSRQIEWPWILRNADIHFDHDCLDIGGGASVLKYAIAKRCAWLTSLDNNPEGLKLAQKTIDHLGFDNIWQVEGDARQLPFDDQAFDRVFCVSVLEHIPDGHQQAINEIVRVLRPGGRALITFDMLLQGECKDNFFVTPERAYAILDQLQVPQLSGQQLAAAKLESLQVVLGVLMVCYIKE